MLGGCTPAQLYANANQEANRLWAGWVAYDAEQWAVRQELRRLCREQVIEPALARLADAGRYKDATELMAANYPPVTYFDALKVLDDAKRQEILTPLSKMPACTWPKGLVIDQPGAAATLPSGPFMLVPVQ